MLKITLFLCEREWACVFQFLLFWLSSFHSLPVGACGFGIHSGLTSSYIVPLTFVRSNQVEMKSCCGFCVFKSIYLCMWRRDIFSALFLRVSAIMLLFLPFWYDDLFWGWLFYSLPSRGQFYIGTVLKLNTIGFIV